MKPTNVILTASNLYTVRLYATFRAKTSIAYISDFGHSMIYNSVRRDTKVQKFTEICYKANITLSTLQVYNYYVFADRC